MSLQGIMLAISVKDPSIHVPLFVCVSGSELPTKNVNRFSVLILFSKRVR